MNDKLKILHRLALLGLYETMLDPASTAKLVKVHDNCYCFKLFRGTKLPLSVEIKPNYIIFRFINVYA